MPLSPMLRFSIVVRTRAPESSVIPAPRQTTPSSVKNHDFFADSVPSWERKSSPWAPRLSSKRTPPANGVSAITVPSATPAGTVSFAVLSYAGTLTVTVLVDPEDVPEHEALAVALAAELDALTVAPAPMP